LVEHTGIDRSTMADVVRRLVKKRLVHRRRSRHDSRAYALLITPEGRSLLALAKPMASRVERQLLSVLPTNRMREFLVNLTRIVESNGSGG
jgi:DNA-binding MarR family transcriptional regulator